MNNCINVRPGDLIEFLYQNKFIIGRLEEIKENKYFLYTYDKTNTVIEVDKEEIKILKAYVTAPGERGIILHNIDISSISIEEQYKKLKEERKEFDEALQEAIINKSTENIDHVIAELLDEFQSGISLVLKMLGVTAGDIMQQYYKHENKMNNRPRQKY